MKDENCGYAIIKNFSITNDFGHIDPNREKLKKFVESTIGILKKNWNNQYSVEYSNVADEYLKLFLPKNTDIDDHNFLAPEIFVGDLESVYWSNNIDDLKIILRAKKYNVFL